MKKSLAICAATAAMTLSLAGSASGFRTVALGLSYVVVLTEPVSLGEKHRCEYDSLSACSGGWPRGRTRMRRRSSRPFRLP